MENKSGEEEHHCIIYREMKVNVVKTVQFVRIRRETTEQSIHIQEGEVQL